VAGRACDAALPRRRPLAVRQLRRRLTHFEVYEAEDVVPICYHLPDELENSGAERSAFAQLCRPAAARHRGRRRRVLRAHRIRVRNQVESSRSKKER
jgi:hypothetical protein